MFGISLWVKAKLSIFILNQICLVIITPEWNLYSALAQTSRTLSVVNLEFLNKKDTLLNLENEPGNGFQLRHH